MSRVRWLSPLLASVVITAAPSALAQSLDEDDDGPEVPWIPPTTSAPAPWSPSAGGGAGGGSSSSGSSEGTTSTGLARTIPVEEETAPDGREPEAPGHHSAVSFRNGHLDIDAGPLRISPSLLLQLDAYAFAGPGVSDYQRPDGTGLKTNLAVKRARIEAAGRLFSKWYWVLGLEAGGESGQSAVAPADNLVGYDAHRYLHVQVGQFRIPFTMENVTDERWTSFMERSLMVRSLGAPNVRDLGAMVWGGTSKSMFWYALGYFGGEGQNHPSVDDRGDVVGRVLFRPLADSKWCDREVSRLHFGASARWGRRNWSNVRYDAPTLSTPGGYAFFSPVYSTPAGETHVLPSNEQRAIAFELFVPFLSRFDLRAEAMILDEGRRESYAGSLGTNIERAGTLSAATYYVQATWWPMGHPWLSRLPGNYEMPGRHEREIPMHDQRALEIAVRWEQIFADYDGVARSYDGNGKRYSDVTQSGLNQRSANQRVTGMRIDDLQLAASYWVTRALRITLQWSTYFFPGSPSDNLLRAPGTQPNATMAGANHLHEASLRVQLAL